MCFPGYGLLAAWPKLGLYLLEVITEEDGSRKGPRGPGAGPTPRGTGTFQIKAGSTGVFHGKGAMIRHYRKGGSWHGFQQWGVYETGLYSEQTATPNTARVPSQWGCNVSFRLLPFLEDKLKRSWHPRYSYRSQLESALGKESVSLRALIPQGWVCAASSQMLIAPMFYRWNQAHKSSGTNFQGLPSKIDTLKEEMDEAGNKVELCKVQDFPDTYALASVCFLQMMDERPNIAGYLVFGTNTLSDMKNAF